VSWGCGPPVGGDRKGGLPVVVDAGVTGRLVDTVDQAVDAVAAIGGIDRSGCAERARERFGADRMVDDYLRIYRKLGL
jgi:hypothetical protein